MDVKQHSNKAIIHFQFQSSGTGRNGRPGLPVPNRPDGFCGLKATLKQNNYTLSHLRSCVRVAVAVLGILSPTVFMFSVDVKQH